MNKNSIWLVLALGITAFLAFGKRNASRGTVPRAPIAEGKTAKLERFDKRSDNTQVEGSAVVVSILADDNDGSRHQRFIVRLSSGQTVLIAHNVDIAPRISELRKGDEVTFSGVYEWNAKGGVIHWTHRDPANRHRHGWIRHKGQLFQ